MKFLNELPDDIPFTKEELLEQYACYRKDNKPNVPLRPTTKITPDMAEQALTELVEEEVNDVIFVVNPVSKKWTKKDSAAGRLLVTLLS